LAPEPTPECWYFLFSLLLLDWLAEAWPKKWARPVLGACVMQEDLVKSGLPFYLVQHPHHLIKRSFAGFVTWS